MAVSQVEGVDTIDGDAKARTITVDYDPAAVTIDAIRRALDDIGYRSAVSS
jgi:copper chaperone CopZ